MLPNSGSIEKAVSTMLVFVLLINSAQAANTTNNVDGVDIVDGVDTVEIVTLVGVFSSFILSVVQVILQAQAEEKIRKEERQKFNKEIELQLLQNPQLMDKAFASIEIGYMCFQLSRFVVPVKYYTSINPKPTPDWPVSLCLQSANHMQKGDKNWDTFRHRIEGYKLVLQRSGLDITKTKLSLTKETIADELCDLYEMLESHFRYNTCYKYFTLGKVLGECSQARDENYAPHADKYVSLESAKFWQIQNSLLNMGNSGFVPPFEKETGCFIFDGKTDGMANFLGPTREEYLVNLLGRKTFEKMKNIFESSDYKRKLNKLLRDVVKHDLLDQATVSSSFAEEKKEEEPVFEGRWNHRTHPGYRLGIDDIPYMLKA